ncbi:hypothetical protein RA210_U30244 [Rubrivivax sp. A210]|nr:hypothetical protein RA210_U30244 [Rubrivivax sp. A210]
MRRRAYSSAAAVSWMEQGPMTTSRRSSSPWMMRRMAARVSLISVSTAVPAIGKKRIRCSGGGSGVTSRMRWSSVWLVFSDRASRSSLVWVDFGLMGRFLVAGVSWIARTRKNRRGCRRLVWVRRVSYALASPAAERCENQKYAKKKGVGRMAGNVARRCWRAPDAAAGLGQGARPATPPVRGGWRGGT